MSRQCMNCGNEIPDGAMMCGRCGANVNMNMNMQNVPPMNNQYGYNYQQNRPVEKNSNATAAMVCGIVGFFIAGIILGIIAIVLACQSKKQTNGVFTSKAKAGFVLGIVDIVGAALIVLFL